MEGPQFLLIEAFSKTRLSATRSTPWDFEIYPSHFNEQVRQVVAQLIDPSRLRGWDVCHLISTGNGGAQAVENVFLWRKDYNKALGNGYDHVQAAVVAECEGEEFVQRAIDFSSNYGNIHYGKYIGERIGSKLISQGQRALSLGQAPPQIVTWWMQKLFTQR
eukprot:m.13959 g.13959  ORF g.13959 m.13959 type:complete len:162 (+) comp25348_c0_seq1:183-668(+)